jgi:hypothetical protein
MFSIENVSAAYGDLKVLYGVQSPQPSVIRQPPSAKASVAPGPSFTANPMETGAFPFRSAFASVTSSHKFSSVPSTANRFTYARVLLSVSVNKIYTSFTIGMIYHKLHKQNSKKGKLRRLRALKRSESRLIDNAKNSYIIKINRMNLANTPPRGDSNEFG